MSQSTTDQMDTQTTASQKSYMPWVMWLIGALFYCYEFFLQVSPSVMVPDLMRSFNVTASTIGSMSGLYFYGYSSMQIPAGLLLDHLGARRLLTLAILVCALGGLLFGSSTVIHQAYIGRLLIGLGSAFAAIGCMHLAAIWLPLNKFAFLTGIMMALGMLGAVCGQAPLSLLIHHFTWRHIMIGFACIGFILAIICWSIIRDKSYATLHNTEHTKVKQVMTGLMSVITFPQNWVISIYGGLMYIPTLAFGALWGVPFLMRAHHLHRPPAALLVSMIFIGWAVGAPLMGWLSDAIAKRKPPLIIGAIGSLISTSIILYTNITSEIMLGVCLFILGFSSSGFLVAFSIIREINHQGNNATSLAFMNTVNMLGGAAAQPLIGLFLDINWQHKMADGIRIYSTSSYIHALTCLPIGILIALLLTPFIQETQCRSRSEVSS